jgi:hypothetical protein
VFHRFVPDDILLSFIDIALYCIDRRFLTRHKTLFLFISQDKPATTMEEKSHSDSKTARVAAALFFFICVPLALWDQSYVPQRIFVSLDPVATARTLLANEFIFRTSIATHLAGIVIFVLAIVLFSRVFAAVDKHLAQLMVGAAVVLLPVVFLLEVLHLTALLVLKSEPRPTFDLAQQQEAAYFLLRIYRNGIGPGIGKLFLGLSFIPFGMLVLRSTMAPRVIGILLIIGGIGYVMDCWIDILLQRPDYLMVRSYLKFTTLAYFFGFLWFLIMGVRNTER